MLLLQKKTAVAVVSDWLVLSPCVRSSSGAGVSLKGPPPPPHPRVLTLSTMTLHVRHQTLGRNTDCYTERTNIFYKLIFSNQLSYSEQARLEDGRRWEMEEQNKEHLF